MKGFEKLLNSSGSVLMKTPTSAIVYIVKSAARHRSILDRNSQVGRGEEETLGFEKRERVTR